MICLGDIGTTVAHIREGFHLLRKPGEDEEAHKIAEKTRRSEADVIQFSGCRDDQTAADANIDNRPTGAMSHALVKILSETPHITYTKLLYRLRDELKGRYTQVPQMSAGRPMDMNSEFIM
jgi:hypothetical protein